jgi:hypothetical protein
MPTKIIVIVEGGNVQNCYSDSEDVEVEVIDFDNIADKGKDAVRQADAHVQQLTGSMRQVC